MNVLESQTNIWLENLSAWLEINPLELNTKKTKYVISRPRNKPIKQDRLIRFRGEVIKRVTSHKFLGAIFQENLNWWEHVYKIRIEISQSIGMICRLRHLLPIWLKKATILRTSTFTSPLLSACMGNSWKNSNGKFTNTSKNFFADN